MAPLLSSGIQKHVSKFYQKDLTEHLKALDSTFTFSLDLALRFMDHERVINENLAYVKQKTNCIK